MGKKPLSSLAPHIIKEARSAFVSILYSLEQVYNVVSLAKVVLNIIVFSRDSQLDKLVLECSTLLKEAVYFTCNFHL